jgi:FkbM family methyltransferase
MLPEKVLEALHHKTGLILGKGWGGGTAEDEARLALTRLSAMKTESKVVFDVGANTGAYTQACLRFAPDVRVFAFEPSLSSFQSLHQNFSRTSRVTLINAACSSLSGEVTLFSDAPASGLASLNQRNLEHLQIELSIEESVVALRLDDWCSENSVYPDLLKMDVEGHELEVLKGARECLRRCLMVQFEFGGCNIDSRTYFQDFWYLFQEFQFSIFRMSPKGLIHIPRYSELQEYFGVSNYLAVKSR